MGDSKPYRQACQNTPFPICGLGPLFKHGKSSEKDIPKYTNSTTVPNWNTAEGQPATIPPYERWTQDLSGGDSCEVHHCVVDGAPCSAWLPPFSANIFTHAEGDTVDLSLCKKRGFKNVQAKRNWNGRFGYKDIEASGSNDTWIPCDSGASVVAYRSAKASSLQTRYRQLDISVTWEWVHHDYTVDPGTGVVTDTTTTKDQSASLTQVINGAGILNTTALSVTPNTNQTEPLVEYPQQAFAALQKGFHHFGDVVSEIISGTITDVTSFAWTATSYTQSNSFQTETITWDVGAGTFSRVIQQNYPDGGGYLDIRNESYTLTDTTLAYTLVTTTRVGEPGGPVAEGSVVDQITTNVSATLSSAVTAADIYEDIKALLNEWDLSDDKQYPWRTDVKTALAPLVSRDELLTQEFDSATFYVQDFGVPVVDAGGLTIGAPDWVGNTGYTINPNPQTGTYRTAIDFPGHNSGSVVDIQVTPNFASSAAVTYAVIGGTFPSGVTMDAGGHITGTIGDDGHWGVTIEATCGVAVADGSILGAPKPAGYQNYFDFRFIDVRGCCFRPEDNPGFTAWDWYQVGWGMYLADAAGFDGFNTVSSCNLPLNSTQWNNWFQSVNKPSGAWIFYADKSDYFPGDCLPSTEGTHSGAGDAACIVAQKWAETLETWNSQNFARPAGDDKFVYDEARVFCVTNVEGAGEGSTWNVLDPLTGIAPPDGTDFGGYWGGTSVNGFYSVASYSGGVITLGAKAFDVPSNWHSKSNADDAQCFGPLRFPTDSSLLGRAAVTTTAPGTNFTFAEAQPNFGMASGTPQEQIDLYDETFTLLASNVTATRVDDTHFTVAAGDAQPAATWVQVHGAAKWYMNDNDPKGDYVLLEWLADFRSFGESGRLNSVNGCDGVTPIGGGPATNAGGGDVANLFASFSQTAACLGFNRCDPRVVCISPNGETFTNGATYAFPESFEVDSQYGSKWWGYVQQTMTELFWQQPHRPCNIETCAAWKMDDATCHDDSPADGAAFGCPGDEDYVEGETKPPVYYYALTPLVEARITVPSNYGDGQDESAPALPTGIQIGWSSPVTHAFGDGNVAFPPAAPGIESDTGRPGNVVTPWLIHSLLCASKDAGCRFNYSPVGCAS